ncbi:MAG: malto-oligosyltrehalose trehalohydrolase, partial [Gaiellaceae bacterium]
MSLATRSRFGAVPLDRETVELRVWAPHADTVSARVSDLEHPLTEAAGGVWEGQVHAAAGDDYRFVLDGAAAWPDPCSRRQPEGVRGPS